LHTVTTTNVFGNFQSTLDLQVPEYYASNDPLVTYATPLHPNEEHTTSRKLIVGQNQFRVRSW
jgi:hypothetical protein